MAALAASGISAVPQAGQRPAAAQEVGGTRAGTFTPGEQGFAASDAAQGEWVTWEAAYPFWALGASWPEGVGFWPIVAVQFSSDGETWTDTIDMAANTEDGGQPTRDNRLFTPLAFTDGARYVRYQTIDAERRPGEVEGLSFVYIDPTDGPWEEDIEPVTPTGAMSRLLTNDTIAPPEIITREQWGANENWRFDTYGEVWPPEYRTVSHIIIHHTATANRPSDVPNAIRSIYYYHAVEQGWGDIGYNYLVDHNGRIYQGRYGGQDVIGGHSYQFAIGSSGISTIGNFQTVDISDAAKSALVSIVAWVGRDLDPLGTADFWEAPDLPIISSHRDVNATTCPGDRLWNDLPELRQLVAQTLEEGVLDTGLPAGIVPGDRVRVQTDDGSALNLRSTANGSVSGSLADDSLAWVIDGPEKLSGGNWYRLQAVSGGTTGWASAQYLIVDPPPVPGGSVGDYPFGLNLRVVDSVNLRRSPSLSAGIVGTAMPGTWAHVMAGPEIASGWEWYQIRHQSIGDGWVVSTAISPAPLNEDPDALFEVGDTVQATQSASIRPRPGVAQRAIATAASGSRLVISQPPIEVTGYIWYGVYSDAYGGGWMVEDYLREADAPPAGKFEIGDTFRVTSTTNLRATPSTSGSVLLTMSAGATGSVVGGPRSAGGYTWWQVTLSSGTTGWCIENWLVETSGTTTPPPSSGKFDIGDTVRVTERLNLRSAASTAGSVVVVLPVGATGTVLAGPSMGSGYTWWRIQTSAGTGWAVQDWLTETSGGTTTSAPTTTTTTTTTPAPGTGKFDIGDAVRVTERLNLRSTASTSGSVVAVLPVGTTGTVLAGPSTANGYTWWRIQTNLGTGWAVQDWLTETSGGGTTTAPPPSTKFEVGDVFYVNTNANLRSAAGTGSSIVRTLTTYQVGTISGGPTWANNLWWWQISIGGSSGWADESVLTLGEPPTNPDSGIKVGSTVRVTERANLRSGAGTSFGVVTIMAVGSTGTVIDGPSSANGYRWWRVQFSGATGWIIDDVLVVGGGTTTPAPSGYPAGTAVRVNSTNVRLRSSASTSASIIVVLQTGTRLTVVSGPTSGSGYQWYQVRTTGGTTGYIVADFISRV